MANKSLHAAKDAKNDEFYTRIEDINEEMNHYEDKFRDKIVFCNCDDPKWSNFWKYFHLNFEYLGLRKLITTHYEDGEVQTYKIEYEGGNDEDFEEGVITPLTQNGDFRSPECLALLDEADIVVTNPPFSLFREYVNILMEHNKQFLIIGNMNALHYVEIFPLIMANKLWLGITSPKEFYQPDGTIKKFGNILWFTTLDHAKRHRNIDTTYLYSKRKELYPELYPKFDNFDAINVNKLTEIPMDYEGIMGVPDTFLKVFNPEQYEILGRSGDTDWVLNECSFFTPPSEELCSFYKKYNKTWRIQNVYLLDKNKLPVIVYSRIFIRKKVGVNNG